MRFEPALLDEIRHRVPISRIVGEHVIWDKRKSQPNKGDYWACCPFHGEKSPSFHADDRKGIYHCFGCGVTGDHFKFLTEKAGYRFPEAVEIVASMGGVTLPERPRHDESDERRQERERRVSEDTERMRARMEERELEAAAETRERIDTATSIWEAAGRLDGSHGDGYLQARGLPPVAAWPWEPHDAIRFAPSLRYDLDRSVGNFPAIVARVQDAWGDTTAIWRIYLDRSAARKAPVENPKVGFGRAAGGSVRIGGLGPKVGIGEGLETCLAAWTLEGHRYPVWAGLSTGGVMAFEPPAMVERVSIFPDGDLGKINREKRTIEAPPGMRAAEALRDRLKPTGIKATINRMCLHGDALDLLITKRNYEKDHPQSA